MQITEGERRNFETYPNLRDFPGKLHDYRAITKEPGGTKFASTHQQRSKQYAVIATKIAFC